MISAIGPNYNKISFGQLNEDEKKVAEGTAVAGGTAAVGKGGQVAAKKIAENKLAKTMAQGTEIVEKLNANSTRFNRIWNTMCAKSAKFSNGIRNGIRSLEKYKYLKSVSKLADFMPIKIGATVVGGGMAVCAVFDELSKMFMAIIPQNN